MEYDDILCVDVISYGLYEDLYKIDNILYILLYYILIYIIIYF